MTVKEIANLAGVSIGTVDRVLHGRGRVSPATRSRIERIVEASGYTPNPIARRLRLNRAYRFFALLPERHEDSGYWGMAHEGILEAAAEIEPFGVETVILEFDRYSAGSLRAAQAQARAAKPDGILMAPVLPAESRVLLAAIDGSIPYVFFDADMPDARPVCAIGQDPFRAGWLAGRLVRLFAGCGQQDGLFAVLNAHGEDYHIKRRRDGFIAHLDEAGARGIVVDGLDMEHDAAADRALSGLLVSHPDLRGVFVTSASAHRIASAAGALRVKRGFAVVGFDLVVPNQHALDLGQIDAIISQQPHTQGRQGLLSLYRAAVLSKPPEGRIEMPIEIYMKENLPTGDRAADHASSRTANLAINQAVDHHTALLKRVPRQDGPASTRTDQEVRS
jgi:LacI family transcriptional regulator